MPTSHGRKTSWGKWSPVVFQLGRGFCLGRKIALEREFVFPFQSNLFPETFCSLQKEEQNHVNKAILIENYKWGLDGEWVVIPKLKLGIMEGRFYFCFNLVYVWYCSFMMSISGTHLLAFTRFLVCTINVVVLHVFLVVKTCPALALMYYRNQQEFISQLTKSEHSPEDKIPFLDLPHLSPVTGIANQVEVSFYHLS